MRELLLITCICVMASHTVFAEKWQSSSKDCTLDFPGGWIFQGVKDITHGQALLLAANREHTKSVSVLRYEVNRSITVQDPKFVKGVKDGFAKSGGRLVGDGYTNINGRVAYWFEGDAKVNGNTIYTLRYALSDSGRLYELVAESTTSAATTDSELNTIVNSFQIDGTILSPSPRMSREDQLSYKIGFVTGMVLVAIAAVAIGLKLLR